MSKLVSRWARKFVDKPFLRFYQMDLNIKFGDQLILRSLTPAPLLKQIQTQSSSLLFCSFIALLFMQNNIYIKHGKVCRYKDIIALLNPFVAQAHIYSCTINAYEYRYWINMGRFIDTQTFQCMEDQLMKAKSWILMVAQNPDHTWRLTSRQLTSVD